MGPAPPQPSSKLANGGLLAHVLLGAGLIDGLFAKPLSDSHSTELYRGDRIVSAITDALKPRAARNHVELPPSTGPDDDGRARHVVGTSAATDEVAHPLDQPGRARR